MKKVSVSQDGMEKLLDNYMYRIFLVYGRKVKWEKVLSILEEDKIDLPKELIKSSYEFTQDQYDANEKDGWNQKEYPNRKK